MDMWSKMRPMYVYVYVLWCVYTISLIGVLTHTDTAPKRSLCTGCTDRLSFSPRRWRRIRRHSPQRSP